MEADILDCAYSELSTTKGGLLTKKLSNMNKMAGVVRKIVQTSKAPGAVGPYRLVK